MKQPPSASLSLRLGKIALGCGTFGREIDQAAAFAVLDRAVARGIVHLDNAEGGGKYFGLSEQILGAWLAARRPVRNTLVLSTKLAAPFAAAEIERRVIDALKRFGQDRVDLLYFWDWDESAADPAVLEALDKLVTGGRIGCLAASNFSQEQLARVLRIQSDRGWARIRAIQKNNNFAISEVDAGWRSFCNRENIAIVTYSPLGAGFLTGKHKAKVEPGSRFDVAPGHQGVYFHDFAWKRLAELEALAGRTGLPQQQIALNWALTRPEVDTVLIGARKPEQIDQAFQAMALDPKKLFSA